MYGNIFNSVKFSVITFMQNRIAIVCWRVLNNTYMNVHVEKKYI